MENRPEHRRMKAGTGGEEAGGLRATTAGHTGEGGSITFSALCFMTASYYCPSIMPVSIRGRKTTNKTACQELSLLGKGSSLATKQAGQEVGQR